MDPVTPTVLDTSAVIELRRYTLHPGKRDVLIDLFDRNLLDPQEAAGMRVLGEFRETNNPDHFFWLRGFKDLPSRAEGLSSFYGGPVWKANRNAANATMIDSDNVLLLRPVDARSGFLLQENRPPVNAAQPTSVVVANIYLLTAPVDDDFQGLFEGRVAPLMVETASPPIARFQTEYARNDFPSLPVREGEHAFVWFLSFASHDEYERHLARLRESNRWNDVVQPELARYLKSPAEQVRLQPTARSLLRHFEPVI
jgi:hypothetical protein